MSIPAFNILWARLKDDCPDDTFTSFQKSSAYLVMSELESFLNCVGVPTDLYLKMPSSSRSLATIMSVLSARDSQVGQLLCCIL